MSTEYIYILGMMQIGLVLAAALFRIQVEAKQQLALRVLKIALLLDASSWLFYLGAATPGWLALSALCASLNNWLVLSFVLLRCQQRVFWWPFLAAALLQASLYTVFSLQHQADWALHTMSAFALVTLIPGIWLLWRVKAPRTLSDQWLSVVLLLWLGICLFRSLLLLLEPSWLLSGNLVSQMLWPGVLVAFGIFAMTSFLEEIQQQLKQDSLIDPLTGLFNRRGLQEAVAASLAYVKRHQHTGALMMIDIDHFKSINDQWGHDIGDHVLFEVAQSLKRQLRQSDILARVGGEEFLIFLPMIDKAEAQLTAERLLASIIQVKLADLPQSYLLTISIGISMTTAEYDFELQRAQADHALYQAKHLGRNRIEFAAD